MTSETGNSSLHQRAVKEFKELLILTAYLFITLGSVNMVKMAVLQDHGIDFVSWGAAFLKAAVLAKFMLLGNMLKVGEHNRNSALIWPTLHKAFAFLLLLIALTIVEKAMLGWFHHQTIGQSVGELFGLRLRETLASMLILLLVLIPYFAFDVLAEALGERRLVKMFLVNRNIR